MSREDSIATFQSITGASKEHANRFLAAAQWNLEVPYSILSNLSNVRF